MIERGDRGGDWRLEVVGVEREAVDTLLREVADKLRVRRWEPEEGDVAEDRLSRRIKSSVRTALPPEEAEELNDRMESQDVLRVRASPRSITQELPPIMVKFISSKAFSSSVSKSSMSLPQEKELVREGFVLEQEEGMMEVRKRSAKGFPLAQGHPPEV